MSPSPPTRSTPSRRRPSSGSGRRRGRLGVPIQIHASATEDEVDNCMREHGAPPGRAARPARASRGADAPRPLRVARRQRARAHPRCRGHRGDQPRREHEARRRRGVRPPGGAGARDPGGHRHRWRRIEQLARPARRCQASGLAAEARRRRRIGRKRRGGPGDPHGRSRPAARRRRPRARRPRRFHPRPDRNSGARHRDARGGARVLGVGVGGRHDGGRGPRADARRGRRRNRGGPRAGAGAGKGGSGFADVEGQAHQER